MPLRTKPLFKKRFNSNAFKLSTCIVFHCVYKESEGFWWCYIHQNHCKSNEKQYILIAWKHWIWSYFLNNGFVRNETEHFWYLKKRRNGTLKQIKKRWPSCGADPGLSMSAEKIMLLLLWPITMCCARVAPLTPSCLSCRGAMKSVFAHKDALEHPSTYKTHCIEALSSLRSLTSLGRLQKKAIFFYLSVFF